MNPVTYQTIQLGKGRHARVEEGACVMELASMLAGEPFGDAPASVCPVIGEFLRTYNDAVDDERRQALYVCAAKVVDSRGSEEQARARAEYLGSLLAALRVRRHPWMRRLPSRCRVGQQRRALIAARAGAMVALHGAELEVDVIDVIDELVALGAEDRTAAQPHGLALTEQSEPQEMVAFGELVEAFPERQ